MQTPRGSATGSGFLFKVVGSTGFIVTNQHVIEPHEKHRIPLRVVFSSGEADEKTVAGTLLAADEDRDLALLSVPLPPKYKPIERITEMKLRETMPVYILGFPFGRALAATDGNPAITIGKGSISSIRKDEFGKVKLLQIDGDVNPGNSGGPMVDTAGNLVGISVATVMGTNIGLAIPPETLERFFMGRVKSTTCTLLESKNGRARLRLRADLIDPLNKLKGVTILWAETGKIKARPKLDKDNGFNAMQGEAVRELTLSRKKDESFAQVEFEVTGKQGQRVEYAFQVCLRLESGAFLYTDLVPHFVNFEQADDWLPPQTPNDPQVADVAPKKGDDWLGGGGRAGQPRAVPQPGKAEAVQSNARLLGEPRKVVDLQVAEVKLGGEKILPCVSYSKDGKFAFVLTTEGVLRAIEVATFKEKIILNINSKCTWMDHSSMGLLVAVAGLQELWVLDERTLKVNRKIPVASIGHVASSPRLDVAFATPSGQHVPDMYVVDLRQGRIVSTLNDRKVWAMYKDRITKHKNGVVLSSFRTPTVTPDGRYLYCIGFECLHQFRINRTQLFYEQMGPRLGNGRRIEVSPDSQYLCLPSGGGNGQPEGHPKGTNSYHTFVYKVGNLQRPVLTINSGAYPRAVGFDRGKGLIYAQDFETTLMAFQPTGMKLKDYKISKRGDEAQQFAVHPGGGRILIVTEDNLYWVAMPGQALLTQSEPDKPEASPQPPPAGQDVAEARKEPAPQAPPPPQQPAQPKKAPPKAKPAKKLPANLPRPLASGKALAGKIEAKGNMLIKPLSLNAMSVSPSMVWSGDGKKIFLINQYLLRAVQVPALTETHTLKLPDMPKWVGRSRKGLVVSLPKTKQVWLIDEQTLKVLDVIDAPVQSTALATHPDLDMAFAVGAGELFGSMVVLDLTKGEIARKYSMAELGATAKAGGKHVSAPMLGLANLVVSPDGRFLLCTADDKIWRCQIRPGELVLQESGPVVSSDIKSLSFGFSGNTVMALGAENKALAPADGKAKGHLYYLFRIEDLNAKGIPFYLEEPDTTAMSVSGDGNTLFFGGKTFHFISRTADGKVGVKAKLSDHGSTLRIMAHPDGKHVLVHTWDKLIWISH